MKSLRAIVSAPSSALAILAVLTLESDEYLDQLRPFVDHILGYIVFISDQESD